MSRIRVRSDFQEGTLSASATDSTTSITSAGFATLPEILSGSDSVIAITIDPGAGGAREIVHITAHGSASTTATVARGMEGTAASAHDSATTWVHAPTASDFEPSAYLLEPGLRPPLSPHAYDIEFLSLPDGEDATDVGLTWLNQGSSTGETVNGKFVLTAQAVASGYNERVLYKAVSGIASVTTKVSVSGSLHNSHSNVGIALRASGTGRLVFWVVHLNTLLDMEWHQATSPTGFNVAAVKDGGMLSVPLYLRITDDGTSFTRWASRDGESWISLGVETRASWLGGAPDGAGLVVGQEHTGLATAGAYDFLRFT